MRIIIALAVALATLSALAAPPFSPADDRAERFEYYSVLPFRETPYADLRGVIPLDKDTAWRRNHYRFAFDDQGRVIEAAFRLRDTTRELNHTSNYYFEAPIIRVEYDGAEERRRYFNHHGRPTTVRGDVFEAVFTTDEYGYRTSVRFFGPNGEPVDSSYGMHRYDWQTLPDGTVIETRENLAGEPVPMRPGLNFGTLRIRYDARGLIAIMQSIDENGNLVENESGAAQDKLTFDSRGVLTSWNVLDAEGNPENGNGPDIATGLVTNNEWGYEVTNRYLNEAGERMIIRYGWGKSYASYDKFGNMTERHWFDLDDEPMINEQQGVHGYAFEYDRSGLQLRKLTYHDLDKEPVLHKTRGFSGWTSDFNSAGEITRLTFVGLEGQPVNRTDMGVATIAHAYDEEGKRTETRFLDAEGQLTTNTREGCAIIRYQYRNDGLALKPVLLDIDGNPIAEN